MDDFALYGYSVFETIPADRGRFFRLEFHYRRLRNAAVAVLLDPPDRRTFADLIEAHHDSSRREILRVALIKTGGRWSQNRPGSEINVLKRPMSTPSKESLRLRTASTRLPEYDLLRRIKCGSRLAYQLESQRAIDTGFSEALHLDQSGRVLETGIHNIAFRQDDHWWTPSLEACILPGIMREYLLDRGLINEREIWVEDLKSMTAAVAFNAVQGVLPIASLDQQSFERNGCETLLQQIGTPETATLNDFRQSPDEF